VEDRDNYIHCSQPHESLKVANENLLKFYDGVSALRTELQIESAVIVVRLCFMHEGESHKAITHATYGDISSSVDMLAYSYGRAKAEREASARSMEKRGKEASS
jgi:hypothetical protein